jgi:hypothetical protein
LLIRWEKKIENYIAMLHFTCDWITHRRWEVRFVIGITLMRKTDVRPFLTVEDFWDGILLGFLVGYTGQQLFEQLSKISATPVNPTHLS